MVLGLVRRKGVAVLNKVALHGYVGVVEGGAARIRDLCSR